MCPCVWANNYYVTLLVITNQSDVYKSTDVDVVIVLLLQQFISGGTKFYLSSLNSIR